MPHPARTKGHSAAASPRATAAPVPSGPAKPAPAAPGDGSPTEAGPPPAPPSTVPPPAPPPAALAGIDRVALSRFLEKPARAAMQARRYPRAIALYRGLAAARGPGNPIALDLARAWTLAGRYEDAADVLDDFIATASELALVEQARAERDRVRKQRFFFDKGFAVPPATGEARRAFDLGRRAFRKKRFAEALVYYETGHALDPEMPGFLRELGATYDRLGAPAERLAFYQRYLHLRPLGQNADFVRRQL
ncbi:MAG TPA: tetratricopeptide repeat protein, partial [Kofleriaceae bacterium]